MLHKEPLPEKPIEVEAISGSFMLVKREAIDDVGVLDEGYFMHCEDLDWCMRFRQRGWKIIFVPEASVIHYQGTCSHARPVFVEWNKHKGMVRFYRKFFRHRYPGVLFWMVVSSVWIRFSMIAAYHALRKIKERLIL
ncbi:MAG: glycosyltransferase family 2 protein [Smithellaceae bacterium]|jgi:GT2 family glycosyltransferase|nr:glycosyltransferase family 2 protein [Smithellaceae bacterium]